MLMSILIMSGMVTAASSFAVITMQNLKQSISVDNGIRAFYSAETGVEDALYEIRKNETEISDLNNDVGYLSNGAAWSRTIAKDIQQLAKNIDENDFLEINLFDADSSLSALSNPIKSLGLSWTDEGSQDAWIEAQITPWDSNGDIGIPFTRLISPGSSGIVNLQGADNVLYKVRIKPLYDDVQDMTIIAHSELNAQGNTVDIPGFLTIYSTGSFSRTNQVVRALMPHRAPLSGNFGYVLFSEESLIK